MGFLFIIIEVIELLLIAHLYVNESKFTFILIVIHDNQLSYFFNNTFVSTEMTGRVWYTSDQNRLQPCKWSFISDMWDIL